jgi:hypothetical protein
VVEVIFFSPQQNPPINHLSDNDINVVLKFTLVNVKLKHPALMIHLLRCQKLHGDKKLVGPKLQAVHLLSRALENLATSLHMM